MADSAVYRRRFIGIEVYGNHLAARYRTVVRDALPHPPVYSFIAPGIDERWDVLFL